MPSQAIGALRATHELASHECLGFPLRERLLPAVAEVRHVRYPCAGVAVQTQGKGLCELRIGSRLLHWTLSSGGVATTQAGFEIDHVIYRGTPGKSIAIDFPDEAVARHVESTGVPFKIRTRLQFQDSRISWLVRSIWSSAQDAQAGRLYGQGLMLALIGLLGQEADAGRSAAPGEFSRARRTLVEELIAARLGENLCVEDMARELGLSPQHFSRMFKKTFGQSPYAYVLARRVEGAQQALLRSRSDDISSIAHAFGFASHAHFTQCFRDSVGVTPSQWKQMQA